MSKSFENNIVKFLKSSEEKILNKRYAVKASIFNTGAFTPSILLVIRDLVDNNFKMKFFKNEDEANQFIQLLMQT